MGDLAVYRLALWLLASAPVEVQRPHDESPTLALSWSADGSCPNREAVVERVRTHAPGLDVRIGDWVPEHHERAELSVAVSVAQLGERWIAELEVRDIDGISRRQFEASDCNTLADATALILAVTLDPLGVASERDSTKSHPSSEPPVVAEVSELPVPEPLEPSVHPNDSTGGVSDRTAKPSAAPRRLRVGLEAIGGASFGPTRAGFAIVGARVALQRSVWRWELGAHGWLPRRIDNGVAGRFDGWALATRGCWVPTAGRVELPLCPGIEAGQVRGRGVPPTPNPTQSALPWIAGSLGLGVVWTPAARLALGLEVDLVVPFVRGSFVVDDREVDSLAVLGARALIGIEVRLP